MQTASPFRPFLLLSFTAFLLAAPAASACSTCGCSLSSDWAAQGFTMMYGLEAGLRFEYFDQTELRSGTNSVNRSGLIFPAAEEIQQRTLNRNTWLDLNYGLNSSWAIAASFPFHDRFHTTMAGGDTDISSSRTSGFGDVRLLARYQRPHSRRSFTVQFGFKLPTGRFDQTFADGPQAGEKLDRGLQLGTGTTDLLAGVAWFSRPADNLGCFASVMFDQPLSARAGFLPSASVTLSSGVRWLNSSRLTPQLQLNLKAEGREHGPEADVANSGGTLAYLSPGITVEVTTRSSAFVFVQLPVYQRVNGLQLEPQWLLTVGWRSRL
ncbi:MAG: hypothetical protein DUW69_000795 [Verrucomicrobia bacterium]|nr:MAG: hypothetical protein DUW69_000795 [Verrucomicrobiota bacterium]